MTDRRRALIVEDRQDWQNILARILDSLGWEYDIASTYDQALVLLEQNMYDLATIDPVLDNFNKYNRDGVRVMVEIHRRFPDTALIVVSGSVKNTALEHVDGLPENLPMIEKQEWDKERFRGLVLATLLGRDAVMGRSTVVRMFKSVNQPATIPQTMPTEPEENERHGVPRILIVEDRQDWQVILARTVEDEGWFWRMVPDAGTALNVVRGQYLPFDVILLDLRLGDANIPLRKGEGWRLLDYLAISDKRSRVIIVSGEASRGDVATLFTKYPIGGFIDKDSFKKNELLALIYNLTAKPKVRIQTLGMFQIWRDGEAIDDYGSPETETLLKVLLTWRGRAVPEEDLMKLVFPTRVLDDPESVKILLKETINRARRLLEPNLTVPESSAFIIKKEKGYMFNTRDNVSLDYEESSQLLVRGITHQERSEDEAAIITYEQAIPIHQGEYLPSDRFAPWTVPLRNHLQTMYARMLNRMADLYAKQGDFDKAIETAQLCMQQDPYHESTHRRLMRYHFCNGDINAALTVYTTLAKQRREFFNEEPSEETLALYEAIKAGEQVSCVEQIIPAPDNT